MRRPLQIPVMMIHIIHYIVKILLLGQNKNCGDVLQLLYNYNNMVTIMVEYYHLKLIVLGFGSCKVADRIVSE